ncbi:hypothetical protein QT969_00935 [Rhodococcus sp. CSLK01-03]|uniref:Integron-associated effector binding protein domain-containing protein n=1 Tax=Rhodococcus indonesiensis TaxID=3055869 RepID=A0ABT7RGS6_9NOCA|nr:hypothetical protein [Rhodococcus indonesiensis]MDM7486842.1 hypothetical protein [Rhodococcus indonesiensis]
MSFELTKLHDHYVGGLVLPGLEPGSTGQQSELLAFTEDRIRARGVGEVLVVYICHPEVGWNAVVGSRCEGLSELTIGDSLVRVPAGYFARFVPDGEHSDPVDDVWHQVEIAEKEGLIERAHREEVAVIGPSGLTELYISLA